MRIRKTVVDQFGVGDEQDFQLDHARDQRRNFHHREHFLNPSNVRPSRTLVKSLFLQ